MRGTALTGFLCLELYGLPLSFDPEALLLSVVKCVKEFIFEIKDFVSMYSCLCTMCGVQVKVLIYQPHFYTYLCTASGEDLSRFGSIRCGKRS